MAIRTVGPESTGDPTSIIEIVSVTFVAHCSGPTEAMMVLSLTVTPILQVPMVGGVKTLVYLIVLVFGGGRVNACVAGPTFTT